MNRLSLLSCSALVTACIAVGTSACAQDIREYDIPAGALGDALQAFATQSDEQIFFTKALVAGRRSEGLQGWFSSSNALNRLLAGTGLAWSRTDAGVIVLRKEGRGLNAEAVTEVDDVIVTGTLLRSSGDLASPVLILNRDALDRRGLGTVAETLTSLPQNYAGAATPLVQAADSDLGASNDVYAIGVNLRGLGPASTLVLVNGRRMAGTGSRAEFADVSALPSAAVERVDVLLDGASAIYGADAIAGVVNVVMRRSFEGQETRVRATVAEGGGEGVILSHLVGRSWATGAAYVSYEHQTANGLSALDRPYTADGDLRLFGGTDHRTFYSAPGNIVGFEDGAFVTRFAIRPRAGGVAVTSADFEAGAENLQAVNLGVDLLPSLERHSVYGRVTQSVGDRLELTGDLRYSRRAYDIATTPSAGIFSISAANPWFVSPSGAASHLIAYSFARDLGPGRSHGRSESVGLTFGARYDLTSVWSVEAYVAGAEERSAFGNANRVNNRFLAEALGNIQDDPATPYSPAADGYYNPFGDGTANSRAVLDFIGSGWSRVRQKSRATSANVLAQGPILRISGGEVALAVGAQFRQERFETRGETFLSGTTPALWPSPQRERSISAAFIEARLPLVGPDNARRGIRSLELSAAGRIEDYDDFGVTTNPKVGVVWSPLEHLGVRVSWGTSFRAGALPQLFDPMGASALFLSGAEGERILTLQLNGGNPDLKPETSETLTLGVDYRLGDGAAFSLNYFDTRFMDRIARPLTENAAATLTDPAARPFVIFVTPAAVPADQALIESYASLPGFSGLYPTEAYGAIVDGRWVNSGAVRVRGIDASGRYSLPVAAGTLMLDVAASWILDYETRPTPTAPMREVAGLIGYPVGFRARGGMSWSRGEVDLGLHWTRVAAYRDNLGTRIGASDTLDARLGWSPGGYGSAAGLRLALSVENLLDETPPFYDAPTGYGFDAGQASPLGRAVSLQLIKRW